ncbi:spore coat associated protein CotJA [[Clostridium] spiroforme]|nr:spore coat associated protein CotJA [Thomasclavelia spiroformis]MBM6879578.1 spore coat associated protein CotJA [Thomasclavelia spiroformis]MBM6930125.1 spore coat associated protein CotJA [Thomasclavelia spiroformis]
MKDLELAISSIQIQKFKDIYPMKQAFDNGTIFKQLNKPWVKYHG